MAELFGWVFKRKDEIDSLPSFVPPEDNDGAVTVAAGGSYGTYLDLDGTVRSEAELVTKYREMSLHPECDSAIDEIVNETFDISEDTIVDINLDSVDQSANVKKVIQEEFNNCIKILDFNKHAYDIYRRFYVDGRLYYHVIVDEKNQKEGIKEVRYIDPRKIRKVKEISKKRIGAGSASGDAVVSKVVNEYFIFNDKGFNYGNKSSGPATTGLRIAKDSILHTVSGLTDNQGTMVLSYLHKGIKALNQLRTLEDALVIYRLARAPERRIWYIDVGNLPKMKAEQYVRDIMVKHKNRLIYDASSGEVRDDRKFMTMLEDYWLPRREGGRGTEVDTLPGGQTLGQMDDVLYFQKKFLNCLNVPISRLNPDALFSIGRATEISRDEVKFAKFITRIRLKFSQLFIKMLEKQLVLKGLMTIEEFEDIASDIKFDYSKTSYWTELKDGEISESRVNLARNFQDMIGKYYSHKWLRRNVLKQTDEEIALMDKEIDKENNSQQPRWINPAIEQNIQMLQQQDMMDQQQDQTNNPDQPQPGVPGPGIESSQGADPELAQKMQEIRSAKVVVDQMAKKKGNRSLQDESKYKAAVQVVAKNKNLLAQMGTGNQLPNTGS